MKKIFKTLGIVAFVLGMLFPFAFLGYWALGEGWRFPQLWPDRWYTTAFQSFFSGKFLQSFLLSMAISLTVAVFATALGYITAQYVAYHRQRKWHLRIAYLPFVASPVILATCLLFLWIKLRLAGTLFGVVLAQWMFAFSFAIIFFVPFWSPTIRATEELVYTLGGTARQALQKVLLPMSVSSLRICFFQTFLMSWVQYGVTLMVGGGKVQTLPVLVYFYVNEANITFAAMASLLLTLPPLLLLAFNKQYLWNTHG